MTEENFSNQTPPKNHQFVLTDDGSYTLFNENFEENCHSTSGAYEETLEYYVKGCNVLEKIYKNGEISILEIGFGRGLGFQCTYNEIESVDVKRKWKFISSELESDLVLWVKESNPHFPLLSMLKESEYFGIPCLEAVEGHIQLIVLLGDIEDNLKKLNEKCSLKFDAIYQDAFSPPKNPKLWTKKWFQLLKEFSFDETILSTYSASISVKNNLTESGYEVIKAKGFGKKRSSTRAYPIW